MTRDRLVGHQIDVHDGDTREPSRGRRVARRVVAALPIALIPILIGLLGIELSVAISNRGIQSAIGHDFRLYLSAGQEWVRSGEFYPRIQLAGPYDTSGGGILYPPPVLLLIVPFTLLAAPLWWLALPFTLWMIIWHRPGMWAIAGMLALLTLIPTSVVILIYGTPTIWFVAILAAATRWHWVAPLLAMKPSWGPLFLIGSNRRSWWLFAIALGLVSVIFLPIWPQWIASVANARGERSGIFYSLIDLPLILIPLVAWFGGCHRPKLARISRLARTLTQ